MPSLKVVQTSNSDYAPKYVPTAVFVGGNSGIGRAMAEAFAKQVRTGPVTTSLYSNNLNRRTEMQI